MLSRMQDVPQNYTEPDYEADEDILFGSATLTPIYVKVALLAAQGLSNEEISNDVGFSPHSVQKLRGNPKIQKEIKRIRERPFAEDHKSRARNLVQESLDAIQLIVRDPRHKQNLEAAKFIYEQIEGKATQKVEVGFNRLAEFMDQVAKLNAAGKTLKDVTPESDVILIEGATQEREVSDERLDELVAQFHD